MKRFFIYIMSVIVFSVTSCSDFDQINKNPHVLYDTNAESFVQPILYNTLKQLASRHYSLLSDIMQYTISINTEESAQLNYNYDISESETRALWSLYIQYGNAQYMLDQARKEDNPAMVGVALILRSWLAQIITDTYGDVPYFGAGLIPVQGSDFEYLIPYDSQKDIYIDLFRSMEEANSSFTKEGAANFNAMCDFVYDGDISKWRRLGNSLYLRMLIRAANKIHEESSGIISLGEEYGDISINAKINELYESYISGDGAYPMMQGLEDSARMLFSSSDIALYTPFYATTSAVWKDHIVCSTIKELMIIEYNSKDEKSGVWDPRYFRRFTSVNSVETQMSAEDLREGPFKNGTSSYGSYPQGGKVNNHYGDLKMNPTYSIFNFDEILFLFAEAGARNWISIGQNASKELYLEANLQNILQWQVGFEAKSDYCREDSPEVENFISYLNDEYDYNRPVEMILRQKYVAMFWVGVEAWADYRRTGYPILKTNGPAAENKGILPTRLRYPATEAYQNGKYYEKAVNGWLNGDNNMLTDMWWADTVESRDIRSLGQK